VLFFDKLRMTIEERLRSNPQNLIRVMPAQGDKKFKV
jgi:hypothetical protein